MRVRRYNIYTRTLRLSIMQLVSSPVGQKFGIWGATNLAVYAETKTPNDYKTDVGKTKPEPCTSAGRENIVAYFRNYHPREAVKTVGNFGIVTTNLRYIDIMEFYRNYDIAGPVVARESTGYAPSMTITMSGPAVLVNNGPSSIHCGDDVYALHPAHGDESPWNPAEGRRDIGLSDEALPAVLFGCNSKRIKDWIVYMNDPIVHADEKVRVSELLAHVYVGKALFKAAPGEFFNLVFKH